MPILQPIVWPRDRVWRDLRWPGLMIGIALTLANLAPPRTMKYFCASKDDIAKATLKKFVYEAYPQWAAVHPAQRCPASIDELQEYMNDASKDPWGRHYEIRCTPDRRPGIEVLSFGPDTLRGTADDLRSSHVE